MLELKNISYVTNDGKKVLDNINLVFKNGLTVITGPNGAGKSSLAKIIMGIVKPTTGEVLYNGEDITSLSINERAKKGFSYSFQQPVRFKGITVSDLIYLSALESDSILNPCDILKEVGLCAKDYLGREIDDSLSGGELKRIEIASAIVRDAKVNIFDEPEAGIDLWSFNNLIDVFKKIRNKKNTITLIISHQERIINVADNIVLLNNDGIKNINSKKELDKILDNKCSIKGGVC